MIDADTPLATRPAARARSSFGSVIGTIERHWPATAALCWLIRYFTLYGAPGRTPAFWAGWFDQGHYMASALAFAHGSLAASAHWYPLGYSLAASVFVAVMPSDPFFLLDGLLYVLTAIAFRRAMRALAIPSSAAMIGFLGATLVQAQLARVWVGPWNSSLSASVLWWLIAKTAEVYSPAPERKAPDRTRDLITLGSLAGLLPLVRPMDAISGAICLAFAAYGLWQRARLKVRAVCFVLIGAAIPILPYLALHFVIYGPRPSDYQLTLSGMGFVFGDLGWKSYILLINPRPWYPETWSILEVCPWMLFGAAGIASGFILRRDGRTPYALVVVLILASAIPFLAFVDLQPPGLFRFKNIHYFKWMMPFFGCAALMWLRFLGSRHDRKVALFATVAFFLPLGIRDVPVTIAEAQPARMLMFKSDISRAWEPRYYGQAAVTDSIGRQENVRSYHQMPDDRGVRAIATKRLFASNVRRHDDGEPPETRDMAPYARYGEALSYGVPCWLAGAACALPTAANGLSPVR